jgi:hypothetical protein
VSRERRRRKKFTVMMGSPSLLLAFANQEF